MFEYDNPQSKRDDEGDKQAKLNVIRLDLQHHELFLTLTPDFDHGPPIKRSGKGTPYMYHVGWNPADDKNMVTTNAFGQRLGSRLIREELRVDALVEALHELKSTGITDADRIVLRETVEELIPDNWCDAEATEREVKNRPDAPADDTPAMQFMRKVVQQAGQGQKRRQLKAHAEEFLNTHPEYAIVVQVGNGDLTMNYWNVCYINEGDTAQPRLLHLDGEPVSDRTYSCLIKWKPTGLQPRPMLSIEDVRFQPYPGQDRHKTVWVKYPPEDAWVPCGNRIEFAASNQQIIRDGQVVDLGTIVDQFSDLRHLIRMPNLNPAKQLFDGEQPNATTKSCRPRTYYGQEQFGDVWLGEELFLRDIKARRLALSGPVPLDFPDGADERKLRGALGERLSRDLSMEMRYQEAEGASQLKGGEWRFERVDPQAQRLDIFFRRNKYPWNIFGLTRDRTMAVCLACTASHARGIGWMLEEAARSLIEDYNVYNALLIDEGQDVFQSVWPQGYTRGAIWTKPEEPVGRSRKQLRSTFIIAKQRG